MASGVAKAIGKKLKNPFKPFGSGRGKDTKDALGRIEEKLDKLSSGMEEVGAAATAADPLSGVAGEGTTPDTFDTGTQDAAEQIYGTEEERLAASQSASAAQNTAAVGGFLGANTSGL